MLDRAKRALQVLRDGGTETSAAIDPDPEPELSDPKPKRQTKSTAEYLIARRAELAWRFENVIDVGVNVGTPELYNAFPDERLILVEPSTVRRDQIEDIVARRNAVWIEKGAGSAPSTLTLIEDLENPAVSSFHEKTAHTGSSGVTQEREVEVDTLDNMLRDHDVHGRHFLKIDTEGHELDVVLGATETLRHTDAVMMEVSVKARYVGGYVFSDVIVAMRDRGFELWDVLFVAPDIRTGNRTRFIDALFLPRSAAG